MVPYQQTKPVHNRFSRFVTAQPCAHYVRRLQQNVARIYAWSAGNVT